LEYAEGVQNPVGGSKWNTAHSIDSIIYPSTLKYIPSSLTITPPQEFGNVGGYKTTVIYKVPCKVLVCSAIVPPVLAPNSFAPGYGYSHENTGYTVNGILCKVNIPEDAVLYVPKESIELYKVAPLWEAFTNIKAIEEM
jgi:hypothetical protein